MKISGTSGEIKNAREWGRMDTRMHMAESLCCASEIIWTLSMGYTPIKNKKFLKKERNICEQKKKMHERKGDWLLIRGWIFLSSTKTEERRVGAQVQADV